MLIDAAAGRIWQFLKPAPQGSASGSIFPLRASPPASGRTPPSPLAPRSAAGDVSFGCPMPIRPSIRHRFRDGLLLAGCIRRLCRGVPRTRTVRRVFDRERGVRGFPVVLHSGRMRTYTADALAGWLCAVGFVDVRSDVRGEGGERCALSRESWIPLRKRPKAPGRNVWGRGIHPGEPGRCLHGKPYRAFTFPRFPADGEATRRAFASRFCMFFAPPEGSADA